VLIVGIASLLLFTMVCARTLCHSSDESDHSFQPPPKSKGGKMLGLINWRLKVTINDGRAFIGQMLAFDKHMNLVLADCEEFRHVRPKKKQGESEAGPEQEMKRSLGLVILRGETVVSLSVEGPPPVQDDDKKNAVCATPNSREVHLNLSFSRASQLPAGPGRGMPAGRGMGMVPPCACCILTNFNRERLSLTVTSSL
jgi:small nuclear ribonucleoprotein (snRNP)-like protein